MAVWKQKNCSRCGGDVFLLDKDLDSWHIKCLQCGHIHELKSIAGVGERLDVRREAPDFGEETKFPSF